MSSNYNNLKRSRSFIPTDASESSEIFEGEEKFSCPSCGQHIGYLGDDEDSDWEELNEGRDAMELERTEDKWMKDCMKSQRRLLEMEMESED